MDYIYIGKIVNTHGIKGELRILSDFEFKNRIFIPQKYLYIGNSKTPEIIKTYRRHKNYEMVSFEGYTNINEVLKYKSQDVYAKRADLNLTKDEYLYQDLIGLCVKFNEEILGKVQDVMYNKGNILLNIINDKEFFIPLNSHFISKVDLDNKVVNVQNVEGLI